MSKTVESQDQQKSMVAFATGLLVGGLIIWMFAAPSDAGKNAQQAATSGTQTESAQETKDANGVMVGAGKVSVVNAQAGATLGIEVAGYPAEHGWIAVRDVAQDGTLGRMLGATEYNTKTGKLPKTIGLARATEAGKTYAVVFYTEQQDFDAKPMNLEKEMVQGVKVDFTAQ